MVNWKRIYTKLFLEQLGLPTTDDSIKQYTYEWWYNIRNRGNVGLRLTDNGLSVIKKLDIKTYELPYPKDIPITPQILVFLDKLIDCPYFLTKKSIVLTNERKTVEIALFANNLQRYGIVKAMSLKA